VREGGARERWRREVEEGGRGKMREEVVIDCCNQIPWTNISICDCQVQLSKHMFQNLVASTPN